jgi:hypothetical protein
MSSELESVLKASTQARETKQADGFKEVRSRKRTAEEEAQTSKRATLSKASVKVIVRK